ncbi:MAG: pirin family protein [Flavobacteriales bacterium]|mgnify:CR=1 FL=1|nr:pirin family protein [Flavobacteriales bacterium]
MGIQLFKKKDQAIGGFNGGAIVENKPIGFPQDQSILKPYSTLFYWAHAHSVTGSTIGLHPHRGFEIVTYVIKGTIKHFDTKTDDWITLKEGSFQVIDSANGISHSEELCENSEVFQIWFDPNINKSLYREAKYKDYPSQVLPVEKNHKVRVKNIVGKNSPVKLETENISIQEIDLDNSHSLTLKSGQTYSLYLINGHIDINGVELKKDDFTVIEDEKEMHISCQKKSKLFMISSPKTPSYKTYTNQ